MQLHNPAKQIKLLPNFIEIVFLVILSGMLYLTDGYALAVCLAILAIVNAYIICGYLPIQPIVITVIYIWVSPFRRFISIHQPFYFPTAIPLEMLFLILLVYSVRFVKNRDTLDSVVILFILYYLWGFIEIFNPSGSITIGLLGFRNRTAASAFFIICFLIVKDYADIKKLLNAMYYVLNIVAIYGIFHFFHPTHAELAVYQQNMNQSNYFMSAESSMRRAFSTLTSPGAFGVSMFLLFAINVYLHSNNSGRRDCKLQTYFIISINIIALLLSGSRSSLIASLLFFYTFNLLKYNTRQKIKYTLIAFLGTLISIITLVKFGPTDISTRIMGVFEPLKQGSSFVTRLGLWDILYESITTMPFGFGNGATGIEIGLDVETIKMPNIVTVLTDNEYVTLLYEQGWIGCLLFLSVSIVFIYRAYKAFEKCSSEFCRFYQFIVVLSFVYLLLGIPIQLSQIFPINIFVWILWGSTYSLIKYEEKKV